MVSDINSLQVVRKVTELSLFSSRFNFFHVTQGYKDVLDF